MKKLIYVLIAIILVSCGARKTQISTQDIKLEETTKITEQTKLVIESNQSEVDTSSIYLECFEPINDYLPFTVKGQIYQNVRIKTSKTKKGITTTKKENIVLNQTKDSLNDKSVDIDNKDKVIYKKESFNPWLLIIIIICFVLCYLDYKRQ